MMSDASAIDSTTVDELTGKLVLVIEESRGWHEPDLMHRQLAAKVKNYVRYVRSPDFTSRHKKGPQQTIVRLVTEQPPAPNSLGFFARVAYELSKHGLTFEHQIGEFGTPTPVTPDANAPVTPSGPTPPARPASPMPRTPPPAARPMAQPPGARPAPPPARPTPSPPPPAQAAPPPVQAPPPPVEPEAPEFAAELTELEPAEPWAPVDSFAESAEAEPLELEPVDPGGPADDVTESSQPVANDLFGNSFMPVADERPELEPDELLESEADLEVSPSFGWEDSDTEALPGLMDSSVESAAEASDDLDHLLETGSDQDFLHDGAVESVEPTYVRGAGGDDDDESRPAYFPEEEFGRAPETADDVEFLEIDSETAIIEMGSGKRVRLSVDQADASDAPGVIGVEKPSVLRAIGGAFFAAVAGAIIWALLAVPAGHGAHPLAIAVGLMVGISVRLRGNGTTMPYRVVGIIFTLFGCALGATLAAAALQAMEGGLGLSGIVDILRATDSLLGVVVARYNWPIFASLALALYVAFRLSASKPGQNI